MKEYDVIIVGAGPAGGNLARGLSKKGLHILVIDKEQEIGEPVYTTAGTPVETLKDFSLPKNLTNIPYNYIFMAGPTKSFEKKLKKPFGFALKFKELKQFLLGEAIKNGAEVLIGTTVTHPIREDGKIIGVKYYGLEEGQARGKIVVDASGAEGVLATQLSLRKPKLPHLSIGLEFLIRNLNLEQKGRRLDLYLGSRYIPCGYAWIFPTKKDEARVGIGYIKDFVPYQQKLTHYLFQFIKNNPQTKKGQPLEIHSGFIYASGGIKKHALDNFLAIGDAAASVNPLFGEGIRHSLKSGEIAGKVISEAFSKNDFSEKSLNLYSKLWQDYTQSRWDLVAKLLNFVPKLTTNQWDEIIIALSKLDDKMLKKFILCQFSKKEFFSLGLKLAPKIFKEILRRKE